MRRFIINGSEVSEKEAVCHLIKYYEQNGVYSEYFKSYEINGTDPSLNNTWLTTWKYGAYAMCERRQHGLLWHVGIEIKANPFARIVFSLLHVFGIHPGMNNVIR